MKISRREKEEAVQAFWAEWVRNGIVTHSRSYFFFSKARIKGNGEGRKIKPLILDTNGMIPFVVSLNYLS